MIEIAADSRVPNRTYNGCGPELRVDGSVTLIWQILALGSMGVNVFTAALIPPALTITLDAAGKFPSVSAKPVTVRVIVSPACAEMAAMLAAPAKPAAPIEVAITGAGGSTCIRIGGITPVTGAPFAGVNCTTDGPVNSPPGTCTINCP